MTTPVPSIYTVEHALCNSDKEARDFLLILEDGIPMIEINQHLLIKQNKGLSGKDDVYYFAKYLRQLELMGITYLDVTLDDIYLFLHRLRIEESTSYENLKKYIVVIEGVYEYLARRGRTLHESLLKPDIKMILNTPTRGEVKGQRDKYTVINRIKDIFSPSAEEKRDKRELKYIKHYQKHEIDGIAKHLRLDYACMFLISIYCGFRISSIVSIKLSTTFLLENKISPTFTKTGPRHDAFIPAFLTEMISSYITEMRSQIVDKTGSTSDFLFLTQSHKNAGSPITAAAYREALKTAAKKAKADNPQISMDKVRTHAGRSTFLKRARDRQLANKRAGVKAFTDADIRLLMDWKTMQSLDNYDSHNRIEELSSLVQELFLDFEQ